MGAEIKNRVANRTSLGTVPIGPGKGCRNATPGAGERRIPYMIGLDMMHEVGCAQHEILAGRRLAWGRGGVVQRRLSNDAEDVEDE